MPPLPWLATPAQTIGDQGRHAGGRGLVKRYSTCERHVERVVPAGHPRGRSCALCTTVVEAHENAGHCRSNRACELLHAVKLVQKKWGAVVREMRATSLWGNLT